MFPSRAPRGTTRWSPDTNSNGTPNLQNPVEKWGLQLASRGIVAPTDSRINATRMGLLGWSHGAQAAMVEAAEKPTNTLFRTTVLFYPGCGSKLGFGTPAASTWRPHHDVRFNIGTGDDFFGDCNSRATTAWSTYGSTPGSGHELVFIPYPDAEHGFDGESQTWPTSTTACSTPDVCAMRDADIDSLAFLLSRL